MQAGYVRTVKSALVALLLCLGWIHGSAAKDLPLRELTIIAANGHEHVFQVEVAAAPEERSKGLMFRDTMPDNVGMLFTFPNPRRVTMWMKNTHLALDMLFIDKKRHIAHIKENAQPMDESIIDSGGDVLHVLEINAGLAKTLGIRPGNRVQGTALEIKSQE